MFWAPAMYQDFSTRHDWPVKNAIVDLPIRLRENSRRVSGNLLSPLRAMNKDIARCFADVTNGGLDYVCDADYPEINTSKFKLNLRKRMLSNFLTALHLQIPVVQKISSAVHRTNHYPR